MTKTAFVSRLSVGGPDGPTSATFRIWSLKGKSDVYASVREIAGQVKISLHESGECIAGLVSEFASREAQAVAAAGGSRHQSKWTRLTHTGQRIVTPLQFVIPESELRLRPERATDKQITRIEPPTQGHTIIISCIFSGQYLLDVDWPGRVNGTHLVGSKLLPNGEKFWLVWQNCPTSDLVRQILREAAGHAATTDLVRFSGYDACATPPERTLIFRDFPVHRCLIVLDAALLAPKNEQE